MPESADSISRTNKFFFKLNLPISFLLGDNAEQLWGTRTPGLTCVLGVVISATVAEPEGTMGVLLANGMDVPSWAMACGFWEFLDLSGGWATGKSCRLCLDATSGGCETTGTGGDSSGIETNSARSACDAEAGAGLVTDWLHTTASSVCDDAACNGGGLGRTGSGGNFAADLFICFLPWILFVEQGFVFFASLSLGSTDEPSLEL